MRVIGVKESRQYHMVVVDAAGDQHDVPIDENTYLHMRQLHAHRMPLPVAPSNGGGNEAAVAAIASGGPGWLEMLQGGTESVEEELSQETSGSDDPGEYHSALDEEEGAPQI